MIVLSVILLGTYCALSQGKIDDFEVIFTFKTMLAVKF